MIRKGYNMLYVWILITVSFCLNLSAQAAIKEVNSISHQQWDSLLEQYVDQQGNVNYKAFKKDEDALNDYLEHLQRHEPGNDWNRTEILAYYINLYNAATVQLILHNYPVSSIRDIKQPWGRKWIQVGEKALSLNQIEHKILRKMGEPRIHFALNCASASCPKLLNTAFKAATLEEQLDKVTREFINDPNKNEIAPERIALSALFKWYKKDFTSQGSLLNYISQYSDESFLANAKVDYLKYDWSLNEQ